MAIAGLIIFVVGVVLMFLLIWIGSLAYFGVLNPTRFLPERCTFGSQVICKTDQMQIQNEPDSTMLAVVTNNFGGDVAIFDGRVQSYQAALGNIPKTCNLCFNEVSNQKCQNPKDNPATGLTDPTNGGIYLWNAADIGSEALDVEEAVLWPEGESRIIAISCDNAAALEEGDHAKFTIRFKYYYTSSSPSYSKDISGDVYSMIQ